MDIGYFSNVAVPVIVGICAIFGYLVKKWVPSDRVHDFIPTMVCLLGLLLAIVDNLQIGQAITLNTVFSGMASGLASTGLWEMLTHWVERTPEE